MDKFRSQLSQAGAECHVLKNRIIRKMAELNGLTALAETTIKGDTAVVLGKGDAGAVAKIIDTFSKDTKGGKAGRTSYGDPAVYPGFCDPCRDSFSGL